MVSPKGVVSAGAAICLVALASACTADTGLIGRLTCGVNEAFGLECEPDVSGTTIPPREVETESLHPLPPLY